MKLKREKLKILKIKAPDIQRILDTEIRRLNKGDFEVLKTEYTRVGEQVAIELDEAAKTLPDEYKMKTSDVDVAAWKSRLKAEFEGKLTNAFGSNKTLQQFYDSEFRNKNVSSKLEAMFPSMEKYWKVGKIDYLAKRLTGFVAFSQRLLIEVPEALAHSKKNLTVKARLKSGEARIKAIQADLEFRKQMPSEVSARTRAAGMFVLMVGVSAYAGTVLLTENSNVEGHEESRFMYQLLRMNEMLRIRALNQ